MVRLGFAVFTATSVVLRFAQRAFCARLILRQAEADIVRVPFDFADPPYAPTKAVSAAFSADNFFSTRSRSLFNWFTIPDRFAMFVHSPRIRIVTGGKPRNVGKGVRTRDIDRLL